MTRIGIAAVTAAMSLSVPLSAGMLAVPAHATPSDRGGRADARSATASTFDGAERAHGRRGHPGREGHRARTRMPTPLVVAHRGASGYRPEHTIDRKSVV